MFGFQKVSSDDRMIRYN